MGAVFFAAIVFAGFLAALRAAGFVPAAFFFAGFAETFSDLPLVFAAARRLRLTAPLDAPPIALADRLAAFFTPTRFDTTFADFRPDRLTAFAPEDFDFAAISVYLRRGTRVCVRSGATSSL